mgnify:CR=1 FL=1
MRIEYNKRKVLDKIYVYDLLFKKVSGYQSIELENKSVVVVKGYNEIADYCYKDLTKGSIIGMQGYLNSNKEIIIINIKEFL